MTGECAKIRHIFNEAIPGAIFSQIYIDTTPPLNARKGADLPRFKIFFYFFIFSSYLCGVKYHEPMLL